MERCGRATSVPNSDALGARIARSPLVVIARHAKKKPMAVVSADSVTEYKCGARAGERVKLRKDMGVDCKPTAPAQAAGQRCPTANRAGPQPCLQPDG